MNIEEDLNTLSHHEHFARFVQLINSFREECIAEMHEADTDKLQQLAGRIIAYDQIMQMTDWNSLQKKFSAIL
jgi:hypothetical protein|tara:strand:+ start:4587 stop:4805 length:219 start_codon:yes stop_codon:yes gene_type:complete